MPIPTPEERVGSTMAGKYRLDRILATGGMATVFSGVHTWTERAVAVKILNYEHARDPEVVRRFLQEARAAAQLKHPNVVDVLDMGQDDDGTVYLVLELLRGETLKARMRRGRLAADEIRALIVPVMRAVASAHQKSVVHRDLKPDNVFLATDEQGQTVPKLLDFGIAKVSSGDSSSTRTGMMVGTPHYMSPEQVRGDRDVGASADVWSMGVVLHAAVSGRLPFEGESAAVLLARVLTERARPLRKLAPDAPAALAAVVDRALEFEPVARFADMAEMIAALEAALEGPDFDAPTTVAKPFLELSVTPTRALDLAAVPARGPSMSEPPVTPFAWASPTAAVRPAPRSRLPLALVGVAVLALLLGLSVVLLGGGTAHTAGTGPAMVTTTLPPMPEGVPLPPQPAQPVAPVAVEPVAPVAIAPVVVEPAALEVEPVAVALVAVEPAEADAVPTTEVTSTPTSRPSDPARGASPRPPRAPRRGTRGALILH